MAGVSGRANIAVVQGPRQSGGGIKHDPVPNPLGSPRAARSYENVGQHPKDPEGGKAMTINGDGQPNRRGGMVRKALAASLVAAALSGSALVGSASAAVTGGQTIEAFIGTNLVSLYGYAPGESVKLEVFRKNAAGVEQVIGTTTRTADGTGFIEINHDGTTGTVNDCFDAPNTPNIRPGDRLQTTGASSGVDDEVVRDIGVRFNQITVNTNTDRITVSGHARSTAAAPIVPSDVLELRLEGASAGDNDLRVDIGRNLDRLGNFTRTVKVSHRDAVNWKRNPGEVALEWSEALGEAEGLPPAIFVADQGPGVAEGCPPLGN
jgi:hypothetical protein